METSKAEILSAEMEAVRQEVRELAKHAREAIAHAGTIVGIRSEAGAETRCTSAPQHLGPQDRFIGWGQEARRRNIRFIAYNTRYLIPPWIQARRCGTCWRG